MEKKSINKKKKIINLLRKSAAWIGIVLILISIVLEISSIYINENQYTFDDTNKIDRIISVFVNILQTLSLTCGASFLSVALINSLYEEWRDDEMINGISNLIGDNNNNISKVIEGIPNSLNKTIIHLTQDVTSKIWEGVPCRIFPPGLQDTDLIEALVKSIGESDHNKYFYTGIGMTSMKKAIDILKDKDGIEAYFLIPHPNNCKKLNDKDINTMKESINTLINVWDEKKEKISLKFILLNFLPPFHIHQTSQDCWFAFLDCGKERQEYPATYQYKRKNEKTKNNCEMYHIIADAIVGLYNRHKNDKEVYTFSKTGKVKKSNRSISKEDFINLFSNENKNKS